MGRFQHVANRLSIVGALALIIGSSLVAGVIAQAVTSAAYADTVPYETFCAGTPAGNIVLNDVVVTGALSPASPTTGQQFNVTGLQVQEQLPASVVQDAEAYQRLLDLAAGADAGEGIRQGLDDVAHGRTTPAKAAFDQIRA